MNRHHHATVQFLNLIIAVSLLSTAACAQKSSNDAKSNNQSSTSTLKHYDIKLADLPPPEVQRGPINFSKVIPRPEGAQLQMPAGFAITEYAADLAKPRWMAPFAISRAR